MIERIVPRNKPDESTLGSANTPEARDTSEQSESVEQNTREQLELRFRFAEAVSRARNLPFSEALKSFTDTFVRATGTWPGLSEETEGAWKEFADRLDLAVNDKEKLDLILDFRRQHGERRADHTRETFWPFRYDYDPEAHVINMHFGSMLFSPDQASDEPGVLSRERLAEQREKLRNMFLEIKAKYPDAKEVRGNSWLYNREAYTRFYPASYTSQPTVRKGTYTGGSRWGQFRTKDGAVNPELREQFFKNIEHLDSENLEAAFPLQTLSVSAPIEEFYKEYGIE